MNTRNEIYDELSRLLTDYETEVSGDYETAFYEMLCKIQNSWETLFAD